NGNPLVSGLSDDIIGDNTVRAIQYVDPIIAGVIDHIVRNHRMEDQHPRVTVQPNTIPVAGAGHLVEHVPLDHVVTTLTCVRSRSGAHLHPHAAVFKGVSDDGCILPLISSNRLIRQVSEMASDDANIGMENSSGRIVATDSPAIVLHDAPADQDIVARSIVIVTIRREYIRILSKVNLNRLRDSSPGISFHDAVSDNHILTGIQLDAMAIIVVQETNILDEDIPGVTEHEMRKTGRELGAVTVPGPSAQDRKSVV